VPCVDMSTHDKICCVRDAALRSALKHAGGFKLLCHVFICQHMIRYVVSGMQQKTQRHGADLKAARTRASRSHRWQLHEMPLIVHVHMRHMPLIVLQKHRCCNEGLFDFLNTAVYLSAGPIRRLLSQVPQTANP
jgi:hypothetical protein